MLYPLINRGLFITFMKPFEKTSVYLIKQKLNFMKKSILAVAIILGGTSLFAQELAKNKNGKIFNPEAGDWSISVDATPFINLAADLVHIGAPKSEGAPQFNGLNDETFSISGKYFVSNELAYRGTIRLYTNNRKSTQDISYSTDFAPAPINWPNTVKDGEEKDMMKERDWSVGLAGGMEMRKGTKRLQGYYGGELVLAFARASTKYSYGYDVSAMDADAATNDALSAYTTDFGGNIISTPGDHDERTLANKQGLTSAFGIRGFVGVEFFVAPKISIGGEFGWGLGFSHTGRGNTKSEGIDFLADDGTVLDGAVVSDVEQKTGDRTTEFFLGSDRTNGGASEKQLWMNSFSPQGNLSLNFYF